MHAPQQAPQPGTPSIHALYAKRSSEIQRARLGEAGFRQHMQAIGRLGGSRGKGAAKRRWASRRVRIPANLALHPLAWLDWQLPAWLARCQRLLVTAATPADERAALALLLRVRRDLASVNQCKAKR